MSELDENNNSIAKPSPASEEEGRRFNGDNSSEANGGLTHIVIGLISLPNTGKTTFVNSVTGSIMRVGNFSGTTISRSEISIRHKYKDTNFLITLVDLPGLSVSDFSNNFEDLSIDRQEAVLFLESKNYDYILNLFSLSTGGAERSLTFRENLEDLLSKINNTARVENSTGSNPEIVTALNCYTSLYIPSDQIPKRLSALSPKSSKFSELYSCNASSATSSTQLLDVFAEKKLATLTPESSAGQSPKCAVKYSVFAHKQALSCQINGPEKPSPSTNARAFTQFCFKTFDTLIKNAERKIPYSKIAFFLDSLFMNSVYGSLILLFFLFLTFQFTFTVGNGLANAVTAAFDFASSWFSVQLGSATIISSLIEMFSTGIGIALSFIPVVTSVFLVTTLMERTGYITRVCYLFDYLLEKCGLNAFCIIPIITGATCSIAGYTAARSIRSKGQRIATCFALSFVPCSAKLSVLAMFAQSLFKPWVASCVLLFLYVFGLFFGILVAKLSTSFFNWSEKRQLKALQATPPKPKAPPESKVTTSQSSHAHIHLAMSFQEEPVKDGDSRACTPTPKAPSSFKESGILELPPLLWPKLNDLLSLVGRRVKSYVAEVAWMIILASITFSALFSIQVKTYHTDEEVYAAQEESGTCVIANIGLSLVRFPAPEVAKTKGKTQGVSLITVIGKALEPIFKWVGFDWRMIVALISGLISKEIAASTIMMLGPIDASVEVGQVLTSMFSLAQAASFMCFMFFYLPCISATIVFAREVKNKRIVHFFIILTFLLAYFASVLTYNILS